MCYAIILSTDSGADLAAHNSELVRFRRDIPDCSALERLRYAERWHLGSKSLCSCTFRHLASVELGFGEPLDWYPEEDVEIEATRAAIAIIRGLLAEGAAVDLVDVWCGDSVTQGLAGELEVDVSEVADNAFRFFENYYFHFTAGDGH